MINMIKIKKKNYTCFLNRDIKALVTVSTGPGVLGRNTESIDTLLRLPVPIVW